MATILGEPGALVYGITSTGDIVPILVDANGKIVTTGGSPNPFDQDLNTDDSATFAALTLNGKTLVLSNSLTLASGVYTPTRSAEANLDSNVTMTEAQYMRVGGTVTVSGRFTADPTLTTTTTSFEMTLPVASNLGAAEDVAGVAFCGNIAAQGAEIVGVAANDTAKVQWKSTDVTAQTWSYTFTYQII